MRMWCGAGGDRVERVRLESADLPPAAGEAATGGGRAVRNLGMCWPGLARAARKVATERLLGRDVGGGFHIDVCRGEHGDHAIGDGMPTL